MLPLRKSVFVTAVFLFMIFLSTSLYAAQTVAAGGEDFMASFLTIPALATGILAATEFLKKLFSLKGNAAKYLSWGVSLTLSGIGWFFQYGMFTGTEWYYILIYGAAAGLMANGLISYDLIKGILALLGLREKPKKKFS